MKKLAKKKTAIRIISWTILGLYVVAYLALSYAFDSGVGGAVRDILYTLIGLTTIGFSLVAAVRSRGTDRHIWFLFAMAGLFWALGDVTLRVCEVMGIIGPKRVLCYPDIFYFAAYGCLAFLVVFMSRLIGNEKESNDWARLYPVSLFGLVLAISVLLAAFFPEGIARAYLGGNPITFAGIINYVYPALDIGIVAGLLVILFGRRAAFRKAWHEILIFGLSVFAVADLTYSLFEPAGIYDPANFQSRIIIAMWLLSYGLMTMAAVYKITDRKVALIQND